MSAVERYFVFAPSDTVEDDVAEVIDLGYRGALNGRHTSAQSAITAAKINGYPVETGNLVRITIEKLEMPK